MKIGLFFGSFNPVHNGHLIIANFVCETTELDQVWLVVSPHNPLKKKESLENEYQRIHLINLALENNHNLKASNIEFKLPQPSYTVNTLAYLQEKHPQHEFSLIMGSDNLQTIHKWKNYELIMSRYKIYVYKRKGYEADLYSGLGNIEILDVPFLDISATFIRDQIKRGISVQFFLPDSVWLYIDVNRMYQ